MHTKVFSIVFLLVFLLCQVSRAWAGEPQINGETAVLIDAKSAKVLYGKEENKRMYPASTTKILTALIALERADLQDVVTIGPNPSKAGGTSIWLQEGEKLTLEELLYALLLNSANDAGVAIAEHIAGSVEAFAELANNRAKELGARNTHFVNPHGMPNKDHYSAAYDLALIGRAAMQNAKFRTIVSTVHHQVPRADPEAQKYLFNHNKLIWSEQFGYKGATGIKTGYTVEAGQCIVASAERNGQELIAVVLRSEGSNTWTDATKLLDYGFANFTTHQLISRGKIMANLPVQYGKGTIDLLAKEDFFYTFTKQSSANLQVSTEPVEEVIAPVTKGQVLGAVVIRDGEKEVGRVDLVATQAVERDWQALLKSRAKWLIPSLVVLLWIRRRIIVNRRKRQRLARRMKYYKDGL